MGAHSNAHRCARAHQTLAYYTSISGTDREDVLTDLLADIRHLCDEDTELDFEDALRLSAANYEAEVAEARFVHCNECTNREDCAESTCCTLHSGPVSAEDAARIELAIGGSIAPPRAGYYKLIFQYTDTAMHIGGRPPRAGEPNFDKDTRWVAAECKLDADRAAEERSWAPCGGLIFDGRVFPEVELAEMGVDYIVPPGFVA